MTASEIETALDLFRATMDKLKKDYDYHYALVGECDLKCVDIVHKLELEDLGYHDRAKLATEHRKVLKDRRCGKDTVALLTPVMKWLESSEKVVKQLDQIIGEVRKIARVQEMRSYKPRCKTEMGVQG